ncbi:MAG: terminase small subunit [Micrococcaceae bacterium]
MAKSKNLVSVSSISDAAGVSVDVSEGGLLSAVESAFAQMDWLQGSDAGMMELCRQYARQIDMAVETARVMIERAESDPDVDPAKAVEQASKAMYLGTHLHSSLRSLGGTPMDRKELGKGEDEAPANPLSAMRRKARGASA